MTLITPIIAVILGFVFVLLVKPKKKDNLKLLLAFSGAFLLSTIVFELLPEVYAHGNDKIGIFIMLGILLQVFLEFFSKGAEHGHMHHSKENKNFPWLLFSSLSLHAIAEGFPLEHHTHLLYAVILHKIPIAIILATYFLHAKISRKSAFIFLFLFALMTPLGTFLSQNIRVLQHFQHQITAIVIGILLHIATIILFESSQGHKFNLAKLLVISIAIIGAYYIL